MMEVLSIRLALLLCLLLANSNSFSQKVKIAIEVKNNKNSPIEFATLTLLSEKKQYVCNSNGEYVGLTDQQDSILISSVGFVDSVFHVRQLLNNPIVILRQKVNLMKEIVIKNGEKLSLGNLNLKEDRSIIGGDSTSPTFEIVKLIKTKGIYNDYKLLTVSFKQKKFYSNMPLMLSIYKVNYNGLPGELLIDSPFLIRPEMFHKGVITIDMRSANIILNDEDFYVGLIFLHPFDEKLSNNEWGFKNDAGIFETKKEDEVLTYRRSSHFKNCLYAEYTTGFIIPKQKQFNELNYLEDPQSSNLKPINLIAGVEIEVISP